VDEVAAASCRIISTMNFVRAYGEPGASAESSVTVKSSFGA